MHNERTELLFWIRIMKDHAMFQINTLAPKEEAYIQHSTYYRDFFQQMMTEIERSAEYKSLIPNLLQGLLSFIEYKKIILKGLLTCQVQINLPPSLINHQINEAVEFHAFLTTPPQDLYNIMNIVEYIKIWLSDSIGHAGGLAAFLDPIEGLLLEETLQFKSTFCKLLIKASELEMMHERTELMNGPLRLLANDTIQLMSKFIDFLERVCTLRTNCEALGIGTLSPLIPDHFIREHNYFIAKINDFMRGI